MMMFLKMTSQIWPSNRLGGSLTLQRYRFHVGQDIHAFAIHPRPWLLEEIVKPYNMNVPTTADHLKVNRPALSRLLNGRAALTPEMAIRFEKALGSSAATILRMQCAFDLAQAKKRIRDR
jgi:addiction module HigA family antidote